MSLMEKFADPELIHGLSLSEKLAGAGITTLMGMGITFIVLILLWGLISLISRIIVKQEKPQPAEPVPQEEVPIPAIIAAAVCACEEEQLFVVRKIRRV